MSPQFIVVAVLFIANFWTCWLYQVDLLIKMNFPELSFDNHWSRHSKHIQITTSKPYPVALSLRNGNIFCLKSCTRVTGHFLQMKTTDASRKRLQRLLYQ
ncbi:Hypothetical_protein [Hexamita inflata]|uniref:Hypothetical_protein n=1 Tax=Hexamita inflata TaxID=28002 RepID=A0ABP1HBG3_9EUKA